MYPSAIIWDLETATDLARYAAVNGLEGKSDSELLEELGDKFQKHIYHSILCIGAVIVRREGDHWVIEFYRRTACRRAKRKGADSCIC